MDKELIKGLIAEYQQFVKSVSFVKRAVTLSDNFNYVFVGLRRVGKSYLMYQQIHHLIETGISPEEILFFNVSKPQISGLLMFYVRLYQIEKNRIDKSLSSQCRYLKIELENLQISFLNNDFYEYYRAGRTELDNRYFIRENYDILSDIHCLLLDRDISFTTLHDSSVAEILANYRLIEYVSEEIEQLTEKLHLKFTSIVDSKQFQWTDRKVALAELIYALYAGKCFSNGNTSLKDIAFCCETLFNIEIGDFYRIFLEIRNRKKSRTQFLDKLKEQIINKMDELDR